MRIYSSVVFGIRKQIQAQEGMDELQEELKELRKQKSELETTEIELKNKLEALEKRIEESDKADEVKKKEEIDFLKFQAKQIAQLFKSLQEASMISK